MTYVTSDLHGCYGLYQNILEKIRFSEADTLYVIGDVIDRGEDGMKLLLDLMGRKKCQTADGQPRIFDGGCAF